jgi:hypothetical protein
MTEAAVTSAVVADINQSTLRYNPEDSHLEAFTDTLYLVWAFKTAPKDLKA